MRRMLWALLIVLVVAVASSGARAALGDPLWYPPTEPSPFIPDAARWIGRPAEDGRGWDNTIYLRGTWRIAGPVRRAVLTTAPTQTVRLYLNGRLTLTAHDVREALPAWAEVTDRLKPGDAFVAARVYSEWRPVLYAQMRVEYEDGSAQDFVSDGTWECAVQVGEDWTGNPSASGDWVRADEAGGYYRQKGESIWGREFALLPRQMLRARFGEHNARLREAWHRDRKAPGLRLTEEPEQARWAEQFRDFCRVDPQTGQLTDGAGRVRHLLFTIYDQSVDGRHVFSLPAMDLDQLERDLDLMAKADVHLYMRETGWNWLLTKDGLWAPLEAQPRGSDLPHFERGIDLLDYFVRRAYAHGRYIIFEGDFYWAAHRDVVPPPYRSRYHIYPEALEAQALAMRKIMRHFSRCTNVLGMMIGEEDIVLAQDLENPHQRRMFAEFLRRKFGSLAAFKEQTPYGYDYSDLSAYTKQTRAAEFWPDLPPEEVLAPAYVQRAGVFADARDFLDVPLPHWPRYRSPSEPSVALMGLKSYNNFTPDDPLWIDFYEMREDELLFEALCRWAKIVREAMPRQLLFYSNAQDFTNSWHFLHLFRRAELPFDVIGVGCHDSGKDLLEIPAWATVRKAIKVISSYRPYALAPGSPARGIASGEGEGGNREHPEEVLNYYRGALFDEIGGGAAWTQTYTWQHISGGDAGQRPHETPLVRWLSEFMPAAQGVAFPLRRPVQVLIVRNANLQHSNLSGLDYANVRAVAESLSQLNVEFDIAMDRDLSYGRTEYKVDLRPYRLVILPSVAVDHPEPVWRALDAWLSDPGHRGDRMLVVGRIALRGSRLQPLDEFNPTLRRWLGLRTYPAQIQLRGRQEIALIHDGERRPLTVDFGNVPPTGAFPGGEPFLQTAAGETIAVRINDEGNHIVALGFPLGLAHDPLWGLEPQQKPRDALAPIYEAFLDLSGIDRPIIAPHNLRVYVSSDGRMLLVRERAGIPTRADVLVRLPAGVRYRGLSQPPAEDGRTRLAIELAPWEGRYWKAE